VTTDQPGPRHKAPADPMTSLAVLTLAALHGVLVVVGLMIGTLTPLFWTLCALGVLAYVWDRGNGE
jgi:hypothetical protein